MKARKGGCVLNALCLFIKLLNNKSKNVRTEEERYKKNENNGRKKRKKEGKEKEREGGMREGRRKKGRREGNIMVMRKT